VALHLTLEKGDRLVIDGGIVIDVRRTGKFVQLSVEAPPEITIGSIFKDPAKQSRHISNSTGAITDGIQGKGNHSTGGR